MPRELDGRVVLLTGATDGVGRAAATEFAARGATVTIVGRNAAKTRQTAETIRAGTGNPAVDYLIADLSTLFGMRAVAGGFRARRDRLDILVNNAGAMFQRPVTTVDGLDRTFALNHLAYFVISTELSGLLRATPGSRVVNTASSAHKLGRLDNLETVATRSPAPGFIGGFRAYSDSKLANVVFTQELSERLPGVAVNCHHPGYSRSRFFGHTTGAWSYLVDSRLARMVARPPEHTSKTLVWLATDEAAGAYRGEYFVQRKVVRRPRDPQLGTRLWELSESLAAVPPGRDALARGPAV